MSADAKPWGVLFKTSMALAVRQPVDPKTVTRRVEPRWARCGVGRELWVRETYAFPRSCEALSPTAVGEKAIDAGYSGPWAPTWYAADGEYNYAVTTAGAERYWGGRGRWRPSLLMPRWASRTTLRTVSVTPEQWTPSTRLSEDEARREGFASADEFHALWDAMHPEFTGTVWRVEFRREQGGAE